MSPMTKAEQPTITQSDELAVQAMLEAVSWEARTEEFNIVAKHFARHRATSLAAQGDRYRHKKRGTEYTLIGVGRAQGSLSDEDPVVLYRGDDGGLWVRHQVEFSDGRFEKIASAAPPLAAQDGLVEALEVYADTLCEFGTSSDACGKCEDDVCFGCRARKALSAIKGDKS